MPAMPSKEEIIKDLCSFVDKWKNGLLREDREYHAYKLFVYININFQVIFLFFANSRILQVAKNKAIEFLEDENLVLNLKIECQKIVKKLKDI
jgi:hypothetical protein